MSSASSTSPPTESSTARFATWHWTDGHLEPSRITIDVVRWGEHLHVAEASRCDERTFAWTGKHRWRLGQRYGSNVLWQCGERTQYGVNVVLEQVWLLTRSPREATRILAILIDGLDGADPFRKKNLPLLRSYQGLPGRMGVDDKTVVTQQPDPLETRVLEQHDSHAAAIAAFDRYPNAERIFAKRTCSALARSAQPIPLHPKLAS